MNDRYVHGYDRRENQRLQDQAGSTVLEVGCGVGAQTLTLARRSPGAHITAIDVSAASVAEAARRVAAAGLGPVSFRQADLFDLPADPDFAPASFDHVFVCFVLEHLARPAEALRILRCLLKPGGSLTVVEGDHGSTYFHPASAAALAAVQCQVALQHAAAGNALIGRELYPLLQGAGFDAVQVSPRMVYVDGSRPDLADSFTRKTFTAMIEGVRAPALAAGLATADGFDQGIRDLHRSAEPDGVFCYTFFKGVGFRSADDDRD